MENDPMNLKHTPHTAVALLAIALLALFTRPAAAQQARLYQLYVGGYPQQETNWSNDTQGVAHDDNNWFITQTLALWKVPVGVNLRTATADTPGVIFHNLSFYPALAGFEHTGDPVVYKFNGVDYLLVPLEGPGRPGTIAIFSCATLGYLAHVGLPFQSGDAGWCGVDSSGVIYSSLQHATTLNRFALNWSLFQTNGTIQLTPFAAEPMLNEQGGALDLVTMQGGEFSPDGLLYLASGFYTDSDALADREGLHILEKRPNGGGGFFWQRIGHSTRGFGHFDYYYNPGTFTGAEEPEGLTIWDLDDGRAPGIRGQLHATVLSNEIDSGDIDFKHYSHVIRVNPFVPCTGVFPQGSPTCPFPTVTAAVNNLAWHGSEVRIRAATYSGPLTISRRIRLTAEGGVVRIGH
jgi:hypothetical protein